MDHAPYASARRVFWIVDNGSSHRGPAAVERLARRWPNLVLVHLPIHASWLNQIEIVFSILQRKVLRPNTFESLFELEDSILSFQERYQADAKPFDWKYTRQDLARLLTRLNLQSAA
jgi:transposase